MDEHITLVFTENVAKNNFLFNFTITALVSAHRLGGSCISSGCHLEAEKV